MKNDTGPLVRYVTVKHTHDHSDLSAIRIVTIRYPFALLAFSFDTSHNGQRLFPFRTRHFPQIPDQPLLRADLIPGCRGIT